MRQVEFINVKDLKITAVQTNMKQDVTAYLKIFYVNLRFNLKLTKEEPMATIDELHSMRDELNEEKIENTEEDVKKANEERARGKAAFEHNKADMISVVQVLGTEIALPKAS